MTFLALPYYFTRPLTTQLILGKSLYVCFIDFSKAFDPINSISRYNSINCSWQGALLMNLNSNINFLVKHTPKLSPIIPNSTGLNPGGAGWGRDRGGCVGVASEFLFLKDEISFRLKRICRFSGLVSTSEKCIKMYILCARFDHGLWHGQPPKITIKWPTYVLCQ